jgi:hydroxymethylpyrimidine pyrophosphatase-like HAD family hydrolase
VRCLYVDLDGTLFGPGGALTRDADGAFTLLAVRALEACHRAGVMVVPMTGRRRAGLDETVRLLGLTDYVFEAGGGFVLDGEVHWLTADGPVHGAIEASGAPALLLERFAGRLERHAAYGAGREVSHLLRGAIDVAEADALLREHGHEDLRLVDNGASHLRSEALAGLGGLRVYHLLPRVVSKAAGVAAHARARGFARADRIAVGDSREDLSVAEAVQTLWLVANAVEGDPGLRAELARHPNARVAEAAYGPGVYEAVMTTLAQGR